MKELIQRQCLAKIQNEKHELEQKNQFAEAFANELIVLLSKQNFAEETVQKLASDIMDNWLEPKNGEKALYEQLISSISLDFGIADLIQANILYTQPYQEFLQNLSSSELSTQSSENKENSPPVSNISQMGSESKTIIDGRTARIKEICLKILNTKQQIETKPVLNTRTPQNIEAHPSPKKKFHNSSNKENANPNFAIAFAKKLEAELNTIEVVKKQHVADEQLEGIVTNLLERLANTATTNPLPTKNRSSTYKGESFFTMLTRIAGTGRELEEQMATAFQAADIPAYLLQAIKTPQPVKPTTQPVQTRPTLQKTNTKTPLAGRKHPSFRNSNNGQMGRSPNITLYEGAAKNQFNGLKGERIAILNAIDKNGKPVGKVLNIFFGNDKDVKRYQAAHKETYEESKKETFGSKLDTGKAFFNAIANKPGISGIIDVVMPDATEIYKLTDKDDTLDPKEEYKKQLSAGYRNLFKVAKAHNITYVHISFDAIAGELNNDDISKETRVATHEDSSQDEDGNYKPKKQILGNTNETISRSIMVHIQAEALMDALKAEQYQGTTNIYTGVAYGNKLLQNALSTYAVKLQLAQRQAQPEVQQTPNDVKELIQQREAQRQKALAEQRKALEEAQTGKQLVGTPQPRRDNSKNKRTSIQLQKQPVDDDNTNQTATKTEVNDKTILEIPTTTENKTVRMAQATIILNEGSIKDEADIVTRNQFNYVQGKKHVATVNSINQQDEHVGGLQGVFLKQTKITNEKKSTYLEAQSKRYKDAGGTLAIGNVSLYKVQKTNPKQQAAGIEGILDAVFPKAKKGYGNNPQNSSNYKHHLVLAYTNLFQMAKDNGFTHIQMSLGGAGIFNDDDMGKAEPGKNITIPREKMAGLIAAAIASALETTGYDGTISISTDVAYGNGLLKKALGAQKLKPTGHVKVSDRYSETLQEYLTSKAVIRQFENHIQTNLKSKNEDIAILDRQFVNDIANGFINKHPEFFPNDPVIKALYLAQLNANWYAILNAQVLGSCPDKNNKPLDQVIRDVSKDEITKALPSITKKYVKTADIAPKLIYPHFAATYMSDEMMRKLSSHTANFPLILNDIPIAVVTDGSDTRSKGQADLFETLLVTQLHLPEREAKKVRASVCANIPVLNAVLGAKDIQKKSEFITLVRNSKTESSANGILGNATIVNWMLAEAGKQLDLLQKFAKDPISTSTWDADRRKTVERHLAEQLKTLETLKKNPQLLKDLELTPTVVETQVPTTIQTTVTPTKTPPVPQRVSSTQSSSSSKTEEVTVEDIIAELGLKNANLVDAIKEIVANEHHNSEQGLKSAIIELVLMASTDKKLFTTQELGHIHAKAKEWGITTIAGFAVDPPKKPEPSTFDTVTTRTTTTVSATSVNSPTQTISLSTSGGNTATSLSSGNEPTQQPSFDTVTTRTTTTVTTTNTSNSTKTETSPRNIRPFDVRISEIERVIRDVVENDLKLSAQGIWVEQEVYKHLTVTDSPIRAMGIAMDEEDRSPYTDEELHSVVLQSIIDDYNNYGKHGSALDISGNACKVLGNAIQKLQSEAIKTNDENRTSSTSSEAEHIHITITKPEKPKVAPVILVPNQVFNIEIPKHLIKMRPNAGKPLEAPLSLTKPITLGELLDTLHPNDLDYNVKQVMLNGVSGALLPHSRYIEARHKEVVQLLEVEQKLREEDKNLPEFSERQETLALERLRLSIDLYPLKKNALEAKIKQLENKGLSASEDSLNDKELKELGVLESALLEHNAEHKQNIEQVTGSRKIYEDRVEQSRANIKLLDEELSRLLEIKAKNQLTDVGQREIDNTKQTLAQQKHILKLNYQLLDGYRALEKRIAAKDTSISPETIASYPVNAFFDDNGTIMGYGPNADPTIVSAAAGAYVGYYKFIDQSFYRQARIIPEVEVDDTTLSARVREAAKHVAEQQQAFIAAATEIGIMPGSDYFNKKLEDIYAAADMLREENFDVNSPQYQKVKELLIFNGDKEPDCVVQGNAYTYAVAYHLHRTALEAFDHPLTKTKDGKTITYGEQALLQRLTQTMSTGEHKQLPPEKTIKFTVDDALFSVYDTFKLYENANPTFLQSLGINSQSDFHDKIYEVMFDTFTASLNNNKFQLDRGNEYTFKEQKEIAEGRDRDVNIAKFKQMNLYRTYEDTNEVVFENGQPQMNALLTHALVSAIATVSPLDNGLNGKTGYMQKYHAILEKKRSEGVNFQGSLANVGVGPHLTTFGTPESSYSKLMAKLEVTPENKKHFEAVFPKLVEEYEVKAKDALAEATELSAYVKQLHARITEKNVSAAELAEAINLTLGADLDKTITAGNLDTSNGAITRAVAKHFPAQEPEDQARAFLVQLTVHFDEGRLNIVGITPLSEGEKKKKLPALTSKRAGNLKGQVRDLYEALAALDNTNRPKNNQHKSDVLSHLQLHSKDKNSFANRIKNRKNHLTYHDIPAQSEAAKEKVLNTLEMLVREKYANHGDNTVDRVELLLNEVAHNGNKDVLQAYQQEKQARHLTLQDAFETKDTSKTKHTWNGAVHGIVTGAGLGTAAWLKPSIELGKAVNKWVSNHVNKNLGKVVGTATSVGAGLVLSPVLVLTIPVSIAGAVANATVNAVEANMDATKDNISVKQRTALSGTNKKASAAVRDVEETTASRVYDVTLSKPTKQALTDDQMKTYKAVRKTHRQNMRGDISRLLTGVLIQSEREQVFEGIAYQRNEAEKRNEFYRLLNSTKEFNLLNDTNYNNEDTLVIAQQDKVDRFMTLLTPEQKATIYSRLFHEDIHPDRLGANQEKQIVDKLFGKPSLNKNLPLGEEASGLKEELGGLGFNRHKTGIDILNGFGDALVAYHNAEKAFTKVVDDSIRESAQQAHRREEHVKVELLETSVPRAKWKISHQIAAEEMGNLLKELQPSSSASGDKLETQTKSYQAFLEEEREKAKLIIIDDSSEATKVGPNVNTNTPLTVEEQLLEMLEEPSSTISSSEEDDLSKLLEKFFPEEKKITPPSIRRKNSWTGSEEERELRTQSSSHSI